MTLHGQSMRSIVDNRPTKRPKAATGCYPPPPQPRRPLRRSPDQQRGGDGVPPSPDPIRWGIVGTANIARAQFLPGLREAGGGRAVLVASRDRAKAEAYAT